jgi:hypothetical protein
LLYHSPIYKDKASLKIAYTSNSFKWDELTWIRKKLNVIKVMLRSIRPGND